MNSFRKLLLSVAGTMLLAGHAASAFAAPAGGVPLDHLPVLKGDYFRIDSEAVGRPFHIYIRYPAGYEADPRTLYPVVYLLDGDSLFPILAANHLFLTYDEGLPEAIVVGIAYGGFDPELNRRMIDFTPPAEGVAAGEAGAPSFHRVLETEILPAVERRYRADPKRRILVGQSLGGSFVIYSALTRPDLFWGRIASNPALARTPDAFYQEPATRRREGLGLVIASGSRERRHFLEEAERWLETWQDRSDKPWDLHAVRIEGGTHSAYSTDAYRVGMVWLFGRQAQPVSQASAGETEASDH